MTACPRCKRAEITPLAVDEECNLQRFQCRSCGENFTGPRAPVEKPSPQGSQKGVEALAAAALPQPALPGFSHAPIAPPDPSESTDGLVPAGKCEKCGKPYYRLGKKFEEHVAACDGKPYTGPTFKTRSMKRIQGGSAPAAPVSVAQLLPTVMPQGTQKALDISIEALKVQRSVLEAEIGELNRTIMTLEKLKGLGGVASVPFTPPVAPEAPVPPETPVPGPEAPSETVSAPAGA